MGDAIAQLKQLRNCFERAKKRLQSLPECGVSDAGQPYIQEVADALQSFAAWFGALTFDDYSGFGSARRVHVALAAFDAVVDWVGLHRSQQFANDISGQMAELVEQSQSLDDAVMASFLVERTPDSVTYRTSAFVPQEKRDAVEDGIEAVASLAGHLGVRLQRIALMVGSQPTKASSSRRPPAGGRPRKYSDSLRQAMIADRKREKRKKNPESLKAWLTEWATKHGMKRADALKMYNAEMAAIRRAQQARSS